MRLFEYFTPDAGQVAGLLAVLAIGALFAGLGAFVGGRHRFAAADVIVGWGVVVGVFKVFGVVGPVPFTWLVYGVWAAAVPCAVACWRRDRRQGIEPAAAGTLWRVLVLALPLLVLVTAMRASQWDEFTNWLPNAQYLLRFDAFPRGDLPASPSALPAYPYALPLTNYLASRLAGGFVENAGALFNVLLLLLFAPMFLHVVQQGLKAAAAWQRTWGAAALGILGVTVLSTTFVQKLILTAYADSATAVTLATAGVLGWKMLDALAEGGERADTRALAWQFALAAAVLVSLKQSNLVLLVLLLGGMILVVLRDAKIRVRDFARLVPVLLVPAAVVYASWRYHVTGHMAGGELSVLPLERWLFPYVFEILGRMIEAAGRKGAYFGMMAVLSVFAVRGLWRIRGSFDRMAVMVGAVFIGFNLFLWFVYIAIFGEYQGRNIGSYWRYNTQLGILGCTAAAFGLAHLWRRFVSPRLAGAGGVARLLPALGMAVVVALPLALPEKLRIDARPQKDHMRLVGQDLGRSLPEGARLAVVDPRGNGFTGTVINFELTSGTGAGRGLTVGPRINLFAPLKSPGELRDRLARGRVSHVWVHQPLAEVQRNLGVDLAPRASHLLRRVDGRWELVRSWPYEGYDDPHSPDLPD